MINKSHLLLLLALLTLASCDCVIMNSNNAPPVHVTGEDAIPRDYSKDWTGDIACPEFKNTSSCCNSIFNSKTYNDFKKLSAAFGNQGGGCDVCAANIERFYCYYACSPRQSEFMTYNGEKSIVIINDTTLKPVNITVADISLDFNADHACGIFQSCSKIAFLTEIAAGGSALGFLTFQFDRGISESYSQVHVGLKNSGGLYFNTTPHMCNATFPTGKDEFGYEIPNNCSCSCCSDACAPLTLVPYGSILDGFEYQKIVLAYLFVVLLTIGCNFGRRFQKERMTSGRQEDLQEGLLSTTST